MKSVLPEEINIDPQIFLAIGDVLVVYVEPVLRFFLGVSDLYHADIVTVEIGDVAKTVLFPRITPKAIQLRAKPCLVPPAPLADEIAVQLA